MKRILTVSAMASLVCTALFADADMEARFKAMEDRLGKIEKENESLRGVIEKGQKSELKAVESRIDDIETAVLMNKIQWGAGFQTRVDGYNGELGSKSKYTDNNLWSTKLMLNMASQITEDMKFTGRLSMNKYWASAGNANGLSNGFANNDSMQGKAPNDSSLFVERAYIDYTAVKGDIPVVVTVGRQPSSDGPSHQFKADTKRKSTYSALLFDGAADGIVVTTNLEKATGLPETAVRFAYGKGAQHNADGDAQSNAMSVWNGGVPTDLQDTNFYAVFVDTSIPGVPNSLVQASYTTAKDMFMDASSMGYNNKNIGDLSLIGLSVEASDIMGSGLDLFAHYGISKATANGQYITNGTAAYDMGLISYHGEKDTTGNAMWVGGRYVLPTKGKLGFEYNKGSKNWFSFTQGSSEPTNKLATRGTAYEAYYIHPLNRYSNLRVGATKISYDYTGSGSPLGMPIKIGDAGSEAAIKELLNYYMVFSVNF